MMGVIIILLLFRLFLIILLTTNFQKARYLEPIQPIFIRIFVSYHLIMTATYMIMELLDSIRVVMKLFPIQLVKVQVLKIPPKKSFMM